MPKKIVIKNCVDCEFHAVREYESSLIKNWNIKEHSCWNHKLNHIDDEEKIIKDIEIIPEWCPLEDDIVVSNEYLDSDDVIVIDTVDTAETP